MTEPADNEKPLEEASASEAQEKAPEEPSGAKEPPGAESKTAEPKGAKGEEPPLPAPTFASLVHMLFAQAMMYAGIAEDPASGKKERDPRLMKLHIELIEMLEEKTRGNLSSDEATLIGEALHALRMTYVGMLKNK